MNPKSSPSNLSADSGVLPAPGLKGWAWAGVLAAICALVLPGCESSRTDDGRGLAASGKDQSPTDIPRALVPGIAGEPDMRIRLAAAVSQIRLSVTFGNALWISPTGSGRPASRFGTPLEITRTATEWQIRDASGLTGRFPTQTALEISPLEGFVGGLAQLNKPGKSKEASADAESPVRQADIRDPMILVNGQSFPGIFRLTSAASPVAGRPSPANTFDVIEVAGVEDYLKGVLAAELLTSWPQQAFNAQAVASRSYALHERSRARAKNAPFDVESTIRNQSYKGATEVPQATAAVRQTRGVVLTWNGQVLRAYFSSTSGGRAASARDTWPTGSGFEFNLAGPLQAMPREELGRNSPYYRWTALRTRTELVKRLAAWGQANGHPIKAIRSLETIVVEQRNSVLRPTRYRIVERGTAGYAINAEELRRACNEPTANVPELTASNLVRSGDLEFKAVGDVITLSGRGFGHGVGLCQYSAKELAEKGQDWRAILPKFYPGAKLEKAY